MSSSSSIAHAAPSLAAPMLQRDELETLLHHTEERLRLLRWSDPRTGLLRHELFLDRLGQAAAGVSRGGASFALLMIGVSHQGGSPGPRVGVDEQAVVMQALALRLGHQGRRSDSHAQFGRSCFVALLMGNSSLTGSVAVAHKLAETLELPVDDGGHRLLPSVSIGVALCPQHGQESHAVLLGAHAALDQALRSGRQVTAHTGARRTTGGDPHSQSAPLTAPSDPLS
jgi:diguanylate cyclase